MKYEEIAKMIDHSLLNPTLTDKDIIQGCKIAKDYNVKSVCCRPSDLELVSKQLKGSDVLITSVIGFPHGTTTTEVKVFEANEAINKGCSELDMVLNIGKMKTGDYKYVKEDIKAVSDLCHKRGVIIKVIFENCFLDTEQKISACKICNEIGVDYIKTSTGYGTDGANLEDVKLMRNYANPEIKIKAAGGIRTLEKVLEFKNLHVSRIGATATIKILECLKSEYL